MDIRDVTEKLFKDRGADYIHFGHIEHSELPEVLSKPESFLEKIGATIEPDSQIQVLASTRPRGSRPTPSRLIVIVIIWDGVVVVVVIF